MTEDDDERFVRDVFDTMVERRVLRRVWRLRSEGFVIGYALAVATWTVLL